MSAALQVTPVHYLFRPTDDMMMKHFATLAEQAAHPVIVYNVVPWSYCSPALLDRMMRGIDGLIGVKQSAGDLKLMADLLMSSADVGLIMSAVDALALSLVLSGSAWRPLPPFFRQRRELCVKLWQQVKAGDHAAALKLHHHLLPIWNAIMDDNLPANVKTALALQGRPAGIPRRPMPESSPAQTQAIRAALLAAGMNLAEG